MPRILMRLLKVARALAHRRRHRRRVVRVLRQHIREQRGHPALDGVGEGVDERADAEDGGVPLAQGVRVGGRGARGELVRGDETNEAVLQCDDAVAWGDPDHGGKRPAGLGDW